MGELVKSVLGGGWSLVVGWVVPATLNVLLFVTLVLPRVEDGAFVSLSRRGDVLQRGAVILAASVVLGLLLAAVQTPIYRLLEGYVGWRPRSAGSTLRTALRSPWAALLDWSWRRQLRRKQVLSRRLDLAELGPLAREGPLREELQVRYEAARADPRLDRYVASDAKRGAAQKALLRGQVRRYPVSDEQVVPTRLGNSIRRFEEYGYNRYRLDSQTLWYELTGVAPKQAVTDVERARVSVDFMVSLLTGHVLVATAALLTLIAGTNSPAALVILIFLLLLLARFWYEVAVSATDDWSAAVRSLVNLGRKPLIASLGLRMPTTLEEERSLWVAVSRLSARPFDSLSAELDHYRAPSAGSGSTTPDPAGDDVS
jgi:hypothetical protein